jgi:pimeloyl-ACP methyl ester carboxylesterase
MTTMYAPKQSTTGGHTVQINNIEMYYEEYGAGKPLVLLHGFGGCTQNWHPFIAKLSERYRLILVDLRGHGHSTNPENRFTHREAASDVFLLLDRLGVGLFSAMGISSGGMTLLHMPTSQPKRIDSMVLISATSHFPDQARAMMRDASFGNMPQQVQEMYRECAKRGDAQIGQLITQFNALHTGVFQTLVKGFHHGMACRLSLSTGGSPVCAQGGCEDHCMSFHTPSLSLKL